MGRGVVDSLDGGEDDLARGIEVAVDPNSAEERLRHGQIAATMERIGARERLLVVEVLAPVSNGPAQLTDRQEPGRLDQRLLVVEVRLGVGGLGIGERPGVGVSDLSRTEGRSRQRHAIQRTGQPQLVPRGSGAKPALLHRP